MSMNEADTRAELIEPALRTAGWGEVEGTRVHREVIAPGRIVGGGRRSTADIADFVLSMKDHRLGVIEAKKRDLRETEGLAQAKAYALKMGVRFAFATNGLRIYQVDMETGVEGHVERYPTPQELWERTFPEENSWRDRFAAVPFETRGGRMEGRYYQQIAINRVLEKIAEGEDRILLTLATGTGKTFIAFQIAWKLFHSRWNLSREPSRRPRILFLADRNILANQGFNNFSAFEEDALVRIDPREIRKNNRVPKNGSIFFTIYQTFMSGRDDEGNPAPYFGDYPPDFFDLIVIDECHRGGASDESTWRSILEHFSAAVQLGLTATPKREDNVDTYRYFGEPVYIYSLKEGINDGFLTPFRVRQFATTLDEYVFTPDDDVIEGEIEEGRRYGESEINRIIEIEARERYRVKLLMESIDQREKSLVFCANQDHALLIRDLINQRKSSTHPDYCVRVTANDGRRGEQHLETFQDNEKTIPTILTTSRKLSTGVDARNVRNIVLLRPITSMIEFKQIIGRGTRLFDGKEYFTIYDFTKAHLHFSDPEWDGEPIEVTTSMPGEDGDGEDSGVGTTGGGEQPIVIDPPGPYEAPRKTRVRLADGKERRIQHMTVTTFWGPDGKQMSAKEFMEQLFGTLPEFFETEEELRAIWSDPETRKRLLDGLTDAGFGRDTLLEMQRVIDAEESDLFDVLLYIRYALDPATRIARATRARGDLHPDFNEAQEAFIDFVLAQYIAEGVDQLDTAQLSPLLRLRYGSMNDAVADLGSPAVIKEMFRGFQQHLYKR